MKVTMGQSRYEPGTEYAKAYGAKLRTLRLEGRLSQASVAEILQTSQQTIAKWELGERWPQVPDIPVLARIYHCSVSDLMPPVQDDIIIPDDLDAGKRGTAEKPLKKR